MPHLALNYNQLWGEMEQLFNSAQTSFRKEVNIPLYSMEIGRGNLGRQIRIA